MTRTGTSRAIPLPLTALVALLSALAALAVTGGRDAHAHGAARHAHVARAAPGTITVRELAFRSGMRHLWEDHVAWTRLAIISLTTGSPDTNATVARLLRNQTEIGNAVKPFYGSAAGTALTGLLRQHILIAADLVAAAKASDNVKLADARTRWQRNADQIASFLSRANPAWKLGELKAMLHDHLRLTTQEAVARVQGNWPADIRAYDAINRQALHMADMLAGGIVAQFPGRFR